MTIWVGAQLSPAIASWIKREFSIDAVALRDIGLRDAEDDDIFRAANAAGAVIMTKDADFLNLVDRYGTPPQIIWITCGNTSNLRLKVILARFLPDALKLIEAGETLVEIRDAWS